MALARSASGPGGLSINTGAANTLFGSGNTTQTGTSGGLFGNNNATTTQTTQPSGGLFGGTSTTATTAAPASGGLFGSTTGTGATTTSQPAASGGLFGATATSQPAASGGLFGAAKPAQPATGGLFGGLNSNTATSQPSGGLFGGSTTATTSAPAAGGLFGNTATTSAPAAGGLFGNAATTTTMPAPAAGGLFGGSTATTSAPAAGGLFGASTATSQPQTGGLFGATASKPATTTGGLFGASTQAAPTLGGAQNGTVPGVKIDISNLKSTTRFNDLHESLQKEIEAIDKVIQQQANLQQECAAIMPSHDEQLSAVPNDVEFVRRKYEGVEDSLSASVASIQNLRGHIATDAENAKLSFKVIDNLKLPAQYHYHGNAAIWSEKNENGETGGQDLVSFFSSTSDEIRKRLDDYKDLLSKVEQHLYGVEADSRQQMQQLASSGLGGQGSPSGLSLAQRAEEVYDLFKDLEGSIVYNAGRVARMRESLQEVQLGGYLRPDTPVGRKRAHY